MPQVPQVLPSVQPQGGGSGYLQTQDPAMAFGYGVGRAQEQLGQTIERTGDMLEKHANFLQDRANQAWGNDAFVQGVQQATEVTNWHRNLQGIAAQQALPEIMRKLDEVRESIKANAPNSEAARAFDQDFKRRAAYMISDAGNYAATQVRHYNSTAAKARVKLAIDEAGNAKNDEELQFSLENAKKGVDADATENGIPPEARDVLYKDAADKAYTNHIEALALHDPWLAQQRYDRLKDKIGPAARLQIERNLLNQQKTKGSQLDEISIENGTPPPHLPQFIGGNRRDAIASIETDYLKAKGIDPYTARGEVVPSGQYAGQRALGRYQVMPGNLPQWSKEALGREVSEEEFLANPKIQDRIFDYQFGKLEAKYGNPQDAASAWLTGKPLAEGGAKRDLVTGMTGNEYVDRFTKALGQNAGPGPLLPDSGPEWLKQATEQAKVIAQARTDDPDYERILVSRVQAKYSSTKAGQRQADLANFNAVKGAALDLDPQTGLPKVTSMGQIIDDPVLNSAYFALDKARQGAIQAQVVKNSKADLPMTPRRWDRVDEIKGMATSDKQAFLDLDVMAEDLPVMIKSKLHQQQLKMAEKNLEDVGFTRALSAVHGMLFDARIGPSASDKGRNAKYNQFVGAFQTARENWMEDNKGRVPSIEENKQIAAQLLTEIERPGRVWGTNTYRSFEVPTYEKTKIVESATRLLGRAPTDKEVYDAYQGKLKNAQ